MEWCHHNIPADKNRNQLEHVNLQAAPSAQMVHTRLPVAPSISTLSRQRLHLVSLPLLQGLGLPSLLDKGLPNWLILTLYYELDMIYFNLPYLASIATAAVLSAWTFRIWLSAQWQLLQYPTTLEPLLQTLIPAASNEQPATAAAAASGTTASAEAVAAAAANATSITAAVAVARWLLLSKACQLLSSYWYSSYSSPLGNLLATAVPAGLCIAVAAAPLLAVALLLPKAHVQLPATATATADSGTSGSGSGLGQGSKRRAAAAALLVLEGTWLLSAAATASPTAVPWFGTAAAAGAGAVALQLLHRWAVAPGFAGCKAEAEDEVEVGVRLYLAGQGVIVDTTESSGPVQLVVGASHESHQETSGSSNRDGGEGDRAAGEEQNPTAASSVAGETPAAATTTEAAAAAEGATGDQKLGVRQVMAIAAAGRGSPEGRWAGLIPDLAAAVEGCSLGEEREFTVVNVDGLRYYNPSYCWWQELEDVQRKFKGRVPEAGEVFKYAVAEGCWLDTQVKAVGSRHVEFDANYGLEGQPLVVKVKVLKLHKKQGKGSSKQQ